MFSSPIVYAWITWLLIVGVIAVLRFAAHQREDRQRAERHQRRRTGHVAGTAPDKATITGSPRTTQRRPVPAGYREQLVAAGTPSGVQPAADLATPDPATQV